MKYNPAIEALTERAALTVLNAVNANGHALIELPTPDGSAVVVVSTTPEETAALRAFVAEREALSKGGAR